jgi:hypothetical protein
VLALLDRVGLAPSGLIGRAALPGRASRSVADRLMKLYRHGLIARHTTGLREHTRTDGKPPQLYSLARRGLQVAQERKPAPAISPRREWRAIEQPHAGRLAHDLHALGWAIEFHRAAGDIATDRWRTPRYATGRYPVPQVGSGQRRHQITLNEIKVPDGQSIIDIELKSFTEIKPDLSLELRVEPQKLTFDLLVEVDLAARPSYNRDKFLAYDAFLCGWSLAHPRYRVGRRSVGVPPMPARPRRPPPVSGSSHERERAHVVPRTPAHQRVRGEHWYYAGRDHLFSSRRRPSRRGGRHVRAVLKALAAEGVISTRRAASGHDLYGLDPEHILIYELDSDEAEEPSTVSRSTRHGVLSHDSDRSNLETRRGNRSREGGPRALRKSSGRASRSRYPVPPGTTSWTTRNRRRALPSSPPGASAVMTRR